MVRDHGRTTGGLLLLLMVLVQQLAPCCGSLGDASPHFRRCKSKCIKDECPPAGSPARLPEISMQPAAHLWLTGWGCDDECGYSCMWSTVDRFAELGLAVPQFHGKWPFVRILGAQEPAAALFSLFNLLPHLLYLRQAALPAPMSRLWTAYALVSSHTWIWSAIFHTRFARARRLKMHV